jgi:hypothetical protein
VVDFPLPYHGILGCPTLAKFTSASPYAYSILKVPRSWGVITIPTDNKGVVHYVEQVFRATAFATPGEANEPVVIDLMA